MGKIKILKEFIKEKIKNVVIHEYQEGLLLFMGNLDDGFKSFLYINKELEIKNFDYKDEIIEKIIKDKIFQINQQYKNKLKLIYIKQKGNVARFYFGKPELEKWYGDDWDDAPLEHNAGDVYDRFVVAYKDVSFPFDKNLATVEENYGYSNSPYCMNDFINTDIPYMYVWDSELTWDSSYVSALKVADKAEKFYLGQLFDIDSDFIFKEKDRD